MEGLFKISTRNRALYVPHLPEVKSCHPQQHSSYFDKFQLLLFTFGDCFTLILILFSLLFRLSLTFSVLRCSEDFAVHARKCDELLQHYSAQWRDREVYWSARDRSSIHGDLLTLIVDSFDRSKLYLPKFPLNRTPKRPAYQAYHRHLVFSTVNCLMFFDLFWFLDLLCLVILFLLEEHHLL